MAKARFTLQTKLLKGKWQGKKWTAAKWQATIIGTMDQSACIGYGTTELEAVGELRRLLEHTAGTIAYLICKDGQLYLQE